MNAKLKLAAVGCLISMGMAGNAMAIPTLSNPFDGPFDPFGGFDWDPSGTVMTVGPVVHGGTVTSFFMGYATGVTQAGGGAFATPTMKQGQNDVTGPNNYEYTSYAVITEQVSCVPLSLFGIVPLDTPCGTDAFFFNPTGTWDIYYDESPDANVVTGAGVADGTRIIGGNVTSGGGSFSLTAGQIGSFAYNGDVTFTNTTFINPTLASSNASATLQFGTSNTSWTQPTSFSNGTNGGTTAIPAGALLFQADGNQTFVPNRVPEPATLGLIGLIAAGMGFAGRRRKV